MDHARAERVAQAGVFRQQCVLLLLYFVAVPGCRWSGRPRRVCATTGAVLLRRSGHEATVTRRGPQAGTDIVRGVRRQRDFDASMHTHS
jgi:hypothetical protein